MPRRQARSSSRTRLSTGCNWARLLSDWVERTTELNGEHRMSLPWRIECADMYSEGQRSCWRPACACQDAHSSAAITALARALGDSSSGVRPPTGWNIRIGHPPGARLGWVISRQNADCRPRAHLSGSVRPRRLLNSLTLESETSARHVRIFGH